MGETLKFSSPDVLASYLFKECEPYTFNPVQRIYLALLCRDRAYKLWAKHAEGA